LKEAFRSGRLLRLVSREVAELVLRHFLALVNLLGVLVVGLPIDKVSRFVNASFDFIPLSAYRILRFIEDAHGYRLFYFGPK
jgi:hypothetical protein